MTDFGTNDSGDLQLPAPNTSPDGPGLETQGLQTRLEARLFDAPVTSRIGGYVIVEVLGEGAMGTVYLAYDPELDRRVAVKVLRRVRAGETATATARMEREAKSMAKLSHPNVVAVHEVGRTDEQIFVAMEFIEGGTLAQWCSDHPPGEAGRLEALLDLADGAARGLAAAHQVGLVHRDFKPANALVGADGRLRVADFGLARPRKDTEESELVGELSDADAKLTATGELVGTPAYMAPEQFAGICDERSDQFGWCATFYEAAFGVRPFAGTTVLQVLASVQAGELTRPPPDSRVPGWLRRLLERGLSRDPAERWPSMDAIVAEIARRRGTRWPLAAGAVGLVALGVAGTLALQGTQHSVDCVDPRPRLDAAWGATKQEMVQQAIVGSGVPYAETTWERLARGLDASADAWTAASTETCRAEASSEPGVAAEATRRRGCLRRARELFEFTTDELARADRDLVRASARTVAGLRARVACENETRASTEGDLVDATLAALAQADVQRGMQRLSDARTTLEQADAAIEADQYLDLKARVHQSLAATAIEADDFDGHREHAQRFLDYAERAGDPELRARAWIDLAVAAREARSFEAAEFRVGRAENIASDGIGGTQLQIVLARARAQVASAQQHIDEAIEHDTRAEAMLRDEAPGTIGHALALRSLAQSWFQKGNSEQALELEQRSLEIYREVLGPDHPEMALEHVAMANLAVRVTAPSSTKHIDEAERILLANPEFRPATLGRIHELRGLLLLSSGDTAAEEELATAEEIYTRTLGPTDMAVFYVRLYRANSLHSHDKLEEATVLYRKLVDEFAATPGRANTLAVARMNLADAEAGLGHSEAALTQITKARKVLDKAYEDRGAVWRSTFLNVARVYRRANRSDLASQILEDVAASIEASNTPVASDDRVWLAIEQARIHVARGERDRARELIEAARAIADTETVGKQALIPDLEQMEASLAD